MISQAVNISVDGSQMDSYLARPPEGSGPHPAVIVLQEVFGVNDEMRRVTDLLAGAGYVGLAINYYHRTALPRAAHARERRRSRRGHRVAKIPRVRARRQSCDVGILHGRRGGVLECDVT